MNQPRDCAVDGLVVYAQRLSGLPLTAKFFKGLNVFKIPHRCEADHRLVEVHNRNLQYKVPSAPQGTVGLNILKPQAISEFAEAGL
jgi:hypothetical protein